MKGYFWSWLVTALSITIFLILAGVFVTREKKVGKYAWLGVLIDERKRISLSRLQMLLWTILLVSAFGVVAYLKGAIDIYLPTEVWALMGISVGSAAGSVIVKGTKAGMENDLDEDILLDRLGISKEKEEADTITEANVKDDKEITEEIREKLLGVLYEAGMEHHLDEDILLDRLGIFKKKEEADTITEANVKDDKEITEEIREKLLGVLYVADKPTIWDIFKGEEATDHAYVDIGKVQMFFFTLAVIFGYVMALWTCDLSVKPDGLDPNVVYAAYFPALSTPMLTLLGISHAGYLTVKAAPHTKTK